MSALLRRTLALALVLAVALWTPICRCSVSFAPPAAAAPGGESCCGAPAGAPDTRRGADPCGDEGGGCCCRSPNAAAQIPAETGSPSGAWTNGLAIPARAPAVDVAFELDRARGRDRSAVPRPGRGHLAHGSPLRV